MRSVNNLAGLAGNNAYRYLYYILLCAGLIESRARRLCDMAKRVVQHLRRHNWAAPDLVKLQQRWYQSLQNNEPDYGVYIVDEYLVESWACWMIYSRKYIREIAKPSSMPPDGVARQVSLGGTIVDLGNGMGISTAALKQLFPKSRVIGTNIADTSQWKIATALAAAYGFEMIDDTEIIYDPVDLVFASEYFEHFEHPIQHLTKIIADIHPRYMLIANAFTSQAIGHFNHYYDADIQLTGKQTSRYFNGAMQQAGYEKVVTRLWNNRPALWVRTENNKETT